MAFVVDAFPFLPRQLESLLDGRRFHLYARQFRLDGCELLLDGCELLLDG